MRLSKNSKKAGLALIGSMAGFLISKWSKTEEVYPFILIGGFLGNYIGEEYILEDCSKANVLGYIDRNGQLKLIQL